MIFACFISNVHIPLKSEVLVPSAACEDHMQCLVDLPPFTFLFVFEIYACFRSTSLRERLDRAQFYGLG